MKLTLLQKIRFAFFLVAFGSIGGYLVLCMGPLRGFHLTLLTWSFVALCLPISSNGVLFSKIFSIATHHPIRYASAISWFFALSLNIFTYYVMPYSYVRSATTFLLYRILTNPWPYWLIIAASLAGSIYKAALAILNKKQLSFASATTRAAIFMAAIAIFSYLSYTELIIFFYTQTCR